LFIGHTKLGRKSSKKNSAFEEKITGEEKQIEDKRTEETVEENCENVFILLKRIQDFE
jgi:ABC-type enterochelin transport system substrate-binding protein